MPLISRIDECSFVGGRVHLRGWCFDSRLPVKRVELVFPEPLTVIPLQKYGLPSPDVAASVSPEAANNRFDESVELPVLARRGGFRLRFTLVDGTIVLGDTLLGTGDGADPATAPAPPEPAKIQAEIDAVKRREERFAAQMVPEFLDRGEENTYLHTLRAENAELIGRDQEVSAKLESLVRRLEAEEDRVADLEAELGRIRASRTWRILAPLRALGRARGPAAPERR